MPVLPRNRFLCRNRRRSRPRSNILRRICRFFNTLFSCFPCVSSPDAVESWNSTDIEELSSSEEGYEDSECENMVIRIVENDASRWDVYSDDEDSIPGQVDSTSRFDVDRRPTGGASNSPVRSKTRTLGPAPDKIDQESTGGQDVKKTPKANSIRCQTPFKTPMVKLPSGKEQGDLVVNEIGSSEDIYDERFERTEQFSNPNRPLELNAGDPSNAGPDSSFFLDKMEPVESDIEELQEVQTCPQKGDEKEGDAQDLGLLITGTTCFKTSASPLTNAPLLPPENKDQGKSLTKEDKQEIDKILLGAEDEKQLAWGEEDEGKKKKKQGKGTKKSKKKDKQDEIKDNVLGALPPIPDTTNGIQMAWGDSTVDQEESSKKKKKNKDKKKKGKKGKKKDKKHDKQKQEKCDEVMDITEKQGVEIGAKEANVSQLDESSALLKNEKRKGKKEVQAVPNQTDEPKATYDENINALFPNSTGEEEETKTKGKNGNKCDKKKKKSKGLGHKIGKMLSEVLRDDKSGDENDESNGAKQAEKKSVLRKRNRVSVAPMIESVQEDQREEAYGAEDNIQEEDDFFHPRHRPTSKERPPCRGDPTKGGLLLIDVPITPPEIKRNDHGVGHSCKLSDYMKKRRERELEMMTPSERRIAEEEDRNKRMQEEDAERRMEEDKRRREEDYQRRKREAHWATRALNKLRGNTQRNDNQEIKETGRIIFVQPVNQSEEEDEVSGPLENFLTNYEKEH
eukprot:gene328-9987_t